MLIYLFAVIRHLRVVRYSPKFPILKPVQKVESTIMDREADSHALHLRPIRRIVIPTKQELDDKPVEDQPLPKNNEDDEAMSQIEV